MSKTTRIRYFKRFKRKKLWARMILVFIRTLKLSGKTLTNQMFDAWMEDVCFYNENVFHNWKCNKISNTVSSKNRWTFYGIGIGSNGFINGSMIVAASIVGDFVYYHSRLLPRTIWKLAKNWSDEYFQRTHCFTEYLIDEHFLTTSFLSLTKVIVFFC